MITGDSAGPAQAIARRSGGSPTCQSPVPAESTCTRPASGEASRRARSAPSAIGERQMLPRQTTSSFITRPSPAAALRRARGPREYRCPAGTVPARSPR
ncbi:hypothetical protein G6F63_014889 [Rhizopus arrhizus]|nr:hypothetical protein G6F63_014889 [Rhizopus arrhizus]